MAKGKKTGGRVAGVPNKATAEIKAIAQEYGPAAIKKLAALAGLLKDNQGNVAGMAESEQAQVAANKELLDRGYGKASQPLEHTGDALEGFLERIGRKGA